MTKNKLSIAPPDKKKTLEAFFGYYDLKRLYLGQKQKEKKYVKKNNKKKNI